MSVEANGAAGEDAGALREKISKLQTELEAERSKGLLRRLFGLPPPTAEDTERATEVRREKMRGRLAIALVLALIVVMGLTFWYLLMLSSRFGELTTDDLIALIPMVGTTLLTPLVGLIGAVMGFYYGGQTAVQGAQTATHAASQATEAAQKPATEAITDAATQAARQAATQAATHAATQAATEVVNRTQEARDDDKSPPAG
jgi:type IV secretory pathway TrbL component